MTNLVINHFKKYNELNPMYLSWSQFSNMKLCSLQWYFNYVMKYRKYQIEADVARIGKEIHKFCEDGLNDMQLINGEVDLYSRIDKEGGIPEDYLEHVYFIEDFVNNLWNEEKDHITFSEFKGNFINEWKVVAPKEKLEIGGLIDFIWVKKMGYIDIAYKKRDGSYFLYDIKTGGSNASKQQKAFKQLYYYKEIVEKMGHKVSAIGGLFTETELYVSRQEDIERSDNHKKFSKQSMNSIPKNFKKEFNKIINEPIKAEFSDFFCPNYCSYFEGNLEDLPICRTENDVANLTQYKKVESKDELLELEIL